MSVPNDLITQYYPRGPYNFGALTVGPVRSILVAIGNILQNAQAAVTNFSAQINLATATGAYLRNIAPMYGITPLPNETDGSLRARCFAVISEQKLTCQGIQTLVQDWYSANPPANPPTNIQVFDALSNPGMALAFGLVATNPASAGIFVILLTFSASLQYTALCNYSFANYAFAGYGGFRPPAALAALVNNQWKSAGYLPLWFAELSI